MPPTSPFTTWPKGTPLEPRPIAYSVDEVCRLLRVSKPVLYAALESGEIPGARKIGAQWRIGCAALWQWFSSAGKAAQPNQTWP